MKTPKIQIKLSWKQKLLIVTIATITGLSLLAISSIMGFNNVNNSVEKQNHTHEYKQLSLAFVNNLLKLEILSNKITKDNANEFINNVETLVKNSKTMEEKSKKLKNNDLDKISKSLPELSEEYLSLQKQWLKNRDSLGFTPGDGKLLALSTTAKDLIKVSFSNIEGPINEIIVTQKGYVSSKSVEAEKIIFKNLETLNAVVKDLSWEDNEIGLTIKKYENTFIETQKLITKERNITHKIQPVFSGLNTLIAEQNIFLNNSVIKQVTDDADTARSTALKLIASSVVAVASIVFISLMTIARQLNIQLNDMQHFLKQAAEGNFSQQLPINSNERDEFTQLRKASNSMSNDISHLISKVVNSNGDLLDIKTELEKAVKHLSTVGKEVEQKTQQSTVATQQISIAVNDVANRSSDVNETIQDTSKSVQVNGEIINNCVQSMSSIVTLSENTHKEVSKLTQSSSKMLGIIDVINGLADQTNLLALNAAIESARAGEAGRGFSVVADEVRALAQKTVNATSSIGDIIKGFNDQSKTMGRLMEDGIKLASSGQKNANDAMSSFQHIDKSIQKVTSEMDQIVVAVEEISYNTNDIVAQIKHISEQSDSTKKTRITLENHTDKLSAQAETLRQLTSRFKLSENR